MLGSRTTVTEALPELVSETLTRTGRCLQPAVLDL